MRLPSKFRQASSQILEVILKILSLIGNSRTIEKMGDQSTPLGQADEEQTIDTDQLTWKTKHFSLSAGTKFTRQEQAIEGST